ncbi:MAG: BON domain-containing protein [Pyrinomonadaceae bacterium]
MKLKLVILTISAAIAVTGCETASNTSVNFNARNANSNTAVLVNATATPASRTSNSNVNRADYDKNRADYEKDKGSSTIGQGVNDSWTWFKTKSALAAADDLRDSTINVDVVNDVITLKGTVGTAVQKAQAETVAKSIEGQKGVKNELTVKANDSMTNQMVNGNTKK